MLRNFRRLVVATTLLALTTPSLLAAFQETSPQPGSRQTPIHRAIPFWEVLTRWWAANGCKLDPHGICQPGAALPTPAPVELDNGCSLDPGGCVKQ